MKYNKQFVYEGYTFNTSIELDTSVEKCINGSRMHTIITNDMGVTNYYVKNYVTSDNLEVAISQHKHNACEYVDKRENRNLNSIENTLLGLGFSKQ